MHPSFLGDGDRFLLTFRYVATVEILLVLMSEVGSKCIPKQLPMSDKVSTVKFLFPESHSVEYAVSLVRLVWYVLNYPATGAIVLGERSDYSVGKPELIL